MAGSPGGNVHLQRDLFLVGLQQGGFRAALNQLHRSDGEELHFQLPRFDPPELQQVVRQASEPGGMFADDFEKSPVVAGIFEGAAQQSFRKALNGRQRRLEFMRNVGDEVLADALQAPEFGDVVQHHDGSGWFLVRLHRISEAALRRVRHVGRRPRFQRLHGSGCDREALLLNNSHSDVALETFLASEGAANQSQELRVADHLDQVPSFDIRGVQVQNFGKGAIGKDQAFVRINYGDALDHASQDGARAIALAAERTDGPLEPHRGFIHGFGEAGKSIPRVFSRQGAEISLRDSSREVL